MENFSSRRDSHLSTAGQGSNGAPRTHGRAGLLGLGIGLLAFAVATMPLRAADQAAPAAPGAATTQPADTEVL